VRRVVVVESSDAALRGRAGEPCGAQSADDRPVDRLSADEAGKLLGVSHRIVQRSAHEQGLPVRVGGAPPSHGPSEIELLTAL
jgi:hypothetical protein